MQFSLGRLVLVVCIFGGVFPSTTFYSTLGKETANDHYGTVLVASNGDIVTTGYTESYDDTVKYLVSRYSKQGDLIWSKAYGGSGSDDDWGFRIREAEDGGFFLVGSSGSGESPSYFVVLKISSDGTYQWVARVGDGVYNSYGSDIIEMGDGTLVAIGYTNEIDTGTVYSLLLVRLTSTGTLTNQLVFGSASEGEQSRSFYLDSGGDNFIVGGSRDDMAGNIKCALYKVSTGFSVQWSYELDVDASTADLFFEIVRSGDDTYGIGATEYNTASQKGTIVKLDSSGTKTWGTKMGGDGKVALIGGCLASDGLIAIGYSYDTEGFGERDILVTKISSSGTFQWARVIGTSLDETAEDCSIDPSDGGIIISGSVRDSGNFKEAAIIKLDSNGNGCSTLPIKDWDGFTTTPISAATSSFTSFEVTTGMTADLPAWTTFPVPSADAERICMTETSDDESSGRKSCSWSFLSNFPLF